ncbi:MAG: patatin-like phospholipase family protein [Alphaproteobacteria bacterium]|nr:patatin-like phospholipase family protein [Alphaproteobacteria bacterium]
MSQSSAEAGPTPAPAPERKRVTLALQGGGAHGAFTWGVLDRLLEDKRLKIEGVSGTSAGAMNGAILVQGMMAGGRKAARKLLAEFWTRVADGGRHSIFRPSPFDRMFNGGTSLDHSPSFAFFDLMTRVLSPYQLNPGDINPLRDILDDLIDFEAMRAYSEVKLFVCATNVKTGKIRVFRGQELSPEVLLASACLPHLHRAVEVEGEAYWDGGFMGNPAMFPLIYQCAASDLMLVAVNPIRIDEVPTSARAILDRMNTISFNATMMREMRNIAFVTQLLQRHRLTGRSHLRQIFFHIVQAEKQMAALGVTSKFNIDLPFLQSLHKLGRDTAEAWLASNFDRLGTETTADLQTLFF